MNRAPKLFTIIIAAVLVIIGAIGTFGHLYEDVGAWTFVVASAVMMLGVVFRGL
jgi:membrane protein YdbS with pleckstrin-like domain